MIGEAGGGSGNYDIVCPALPDGKELFVEIRRGRWVDDEASVFVFVFEDILNIVRSDVAAGCASDDDNFEIPGRIAVIRRIVFCAVQIVAKQESPEIKRKVGINMLENP